jgi:2-oxoglutarate ferredoxin oxidoreductase subunit alpha
MLSHGDTKHILLIPSSVGECYTMAMEAFDLAEQFQTLIFVMSDLDLGMNTWMSDAFEYPTKPPVRGKLLDAETLKRLGTEYGRYRDVDGDGMPAYFARGSGHNERGQYSERPDDYQRNVERLARKFETAKVWVPPPERIEAPGAEIGVIGYGTSHWAVSECRDQLGREQGLKTSYLRLRAYPFPADVRDFIERHARVYVVEQNRDAQMKSLLTLEYPDLATKLRSVLHFNGLPIDARSVTDEILEQEGMKAAMPKKAVAFSGGLGGE